MVRGFLTGHYDRHRLSTASIAGRLGMVSSPIAAHPCSITPPEVSKHYELSCYLSHSIGVLGDHESPQSPPTEANFGKASNAEGLEDAGDQSRVARRKSTLYGEVGLRRL